MWLRAALLPVFGWVAAASLDCQKWPAPADDPACAQPMGDVVVLAPGSAHIAKIECDDCPWSQEQQHQQQQEQDESARKYDVDHRDQIFYLHVELADHNRTVLLNGQPIFPLPTIPTPPKFPITQFLTNFSNAQLFASLHCHPDRSEQTVRGHVDCASWRREVDHSAFHADYLYTVDPTEHRSRRSDRQSEKYWEVHFDILSRTGYPDDPQWTFDQTGQKMLRLLVAGTEIQVTGGKSGNKPASDLFGPMGDGDKKYKYRLEDVTLQPRGYSFPPRKKLSIWQKFGHFFGSDVWEVDERRLVFHGDEWGKYGKKGTLRNIVGKFIHWDSWWLFWLVLTSILAGAVALFKLYKFVFWIMEQRQINKWDGIDDMWDRLRQEPPIDEQDAFLIGGYRDDPDDVGSPRPPAYTDEPQTNKPLPDKPLPDKPLPAVPLIDA